MYRLDHLDNYGGLAMRRVADAVDLRKLARQAAEMGRPQVGEYVLRADRPDPITEEEEAAYQAALEEASRAPR